MHGLRHAARDDVSDSILPSRAIEKELELG